MPEAGTPRPEEPADSVEAGAHCRISVADGSTGSGTLIDVDQSTGLVLTCAHLFDGEPGRIIVTFPNGTRFAARLIDRDRAHDLAAIAIRRPDLSPLTVSNDEPSGLLSAGGFGPDGRFRSIRGAIVGQATAVGATHPALTISGAVRPGDSGGGVLNTAGQLVGVVWGQRDCLTYATCGRPVREFVDRIRSRNTVDNPQTPIPSPQLDWQAWSSDIDARIRALDAKKQDKGNYLQAGDLNGYLRIADAPKSLDPAQFAKRSEVESRLKIFTGRVESVHARIETVRQRVEGLADKRIGLFEGLSLGKLAAGALGISGPLGAAIVIAGGLAGRRLKRVARGASKSPSAPDPVAVDSPPPPQRTMTETHYVPVEQDSFAKAHQWASEHVARKYPGATEVLQAQDSLIKQFLAAKS